MNIKTAYFNWHLLFVAAFLLASALLFSACGGSVMDTTSVEEEITASPAATAVTDEQSITIRGDGIEGELSLGLTELLALPDAACEYIYSTINNWPNARFYACRGIKVAAILDAAGVLHTANLVTFRSHDSYEITFTRKQLLEDAQYYFPLVAEGSPEGGEPVQPVIAYEFKEGADDLAQVVADNLCLVIGQRNHLEHTNPAFVENMKEIVVSSTPPEQWQEATIFPVSGQIPAGDSIKLQHAEFGLVKMFYTLDGTEPTELSAMYNPSTYQPELNKPIVFTENAVLKVLVTGFGKEDSPIATFDIKVQ